jgi:anti-sigma factor RsiW
MAPCQRETDHLFHLIDGELDSGSQKKIETHVEECCDCARMLRRIRLQKTQLKRLTPLKTGDAFDLLLRERIRRQEAGKAERPGLFRPSGMRWAPAFAAAVAVMGCGVLLMSLRDQRSSASKAGLAGSTANRTASSAGDVQYVMEDLSSSRPASKPMESRTAKPAPRTDRASADTTQRVRNFDALKGRLAPVSF